MRFGAQVSGTVSEIDADYNSHVRKGQVIARLDPATLRSCARSSERGAGASAGARSSRCGNCKRSSVRRRECRRNAARRAGDGGSRTVDGTRQRCGDKNGAGKRRESRERVSAHQTD
ncbi:MAG: biotin/lipoyl-binding protein [Candidatus Velthaea sp.]